MLQEVNWKREITQLEEDAYNINRLKKQINIEAEVDLTIQHSVAQNIEALKNSAMTLAKSLETQRLKHTELSRILLHVKGKMDEERNLQATQRDDTAQDNINSLENKERKIEYDLSQINSRRNKICEAVNEKHLKINQSRTERVIDSGIFRNIEKQLHQSEMSFEKLLIEKTKHQKEYEKLLREYNTIKSSASSTKEIAVSKNTISSRQLLKEVIEDVPVEKATKKFIEIERNTATRLVKPAPLVNQSQTQREYTIKKIISQNGLKDPEELLFFIENIDSINQDNFQSMNQMSDEGTLLEKQILEIKDELQKSQIVFYQKSRELSKNEKKIAACQGLNTKLKEIQECIQKQNSEFLQFFSDDQVLTIIREFDPLITSDDFFRATEIMQFFEEKVSHYLSPISRVTEETPTDRFSQQYERLEEIINRVKKSQECDKVMKRSDFAEEYSNLIKNSLTARSSSNRQPQKRKSLIVKK